MKPNFFVDPEFPVIDGVGHPDKIGFYNVKGGGSTNTTNLDPLSAGHYYSCSRSEIPLQTTQFTNARFDPDYHFDASGFWQAHPTYCLNAVPVGDTDNSRGSDRIVMSRVEVVGSVYRPAGSWRDATGQSESPLPQFPYHAPKAFVALVLDTMANGAVPPDNDDDVFLFGPGGAFVFPNNAISSPPVIQPNCLRSRYKVLAYDILEFDGQISQSMAPTHWEGNEAGYPVTTFSVDSVISQFSWPSLVKGFRFDVDLNNVLCCFNGPGQGDCSIANIVDNALHLFAWNFNGHDPIGFSTVANYQYLSIQFRSFLWFGDFLSPTVFAPAGADGPVVDDSAPALDILADQSAALAGDVPPPRRKKTKASEGYYNFRPRDGAGMLFPDDPEVAAMPAPGSRGSTKGSRRKKLRSRGFFRDKDARPFDDFLGDDWNDPRRSF